MSRSIHKTIKQVVENNNKWDLADEENPDLIELAQKRRYKIKARNNEYQNTDKVKSKHSE